MIAQIALRTMGNAGFSDVVALAQYLLNSKQATNARNGSSMSGCIYRFECVSEGGIASPSQIAEKILNSATYFVRGIRFHELTDRRNPKPLFAVLFAHHAAKHYFDEMFECLLERSGLHAEVVQPIEQESCQFNGIARAANATDFDQPVDDASHHPIPPSLKEWVQANSR